jgi:hypothetical protein
MRNGAGVELPSPSRRRRIRTPQAARYPHGCWTREAHYCKTMCDGTSCRAIGPKCLNALGASAAGQ